MKLALQNMTPTTPSRYSLPPPRRILGVSQVSGFVPLAPKWALNCHRRAGGRKTHSKLHRLQDFTDHCQFIVCKISPTTANSSSKTILATFKINLPESKLRQFGRYPGSVEGYRHDKELHSYLLIDHQDLGIRFCQRFPQSVHMRSVFEGTRDNLTTELCKLAIKCWN